MRFRVSSLKNTRWNDWRDDDEDRTKLSGVLFDHAEKGGNEERCTFFEVLGAFTFITKDGFMAPKRSHQESMAKSGKGNEYNFHIFTHLMCVFQISA